MVDWHPDDFHEPPPDDVDEDDGDGELVLPVEPFAVVALGAPAGTFYTVALAELPLYRPTPGDVVEVVDHTGRRGVARVQCTNYIRRTAHLVPIWFQPEQPS